MSSPALELDEKTYKTIQAHCAAGDQLTRAQRYREAIAEYNRAWELIPRPKNDWEAATWVLAAIADASYLGGYKTSAREALEYAMTCPGAIGNPFLHLRFGQVLFDAGEHDAAADELIRAYMGGGRELFAAEDPKYLAFLGTRAKL
jgi:tetratricopeptide (TPR) repeat protein